MQKSDRQNLILEVISTGTITRQDELAAVLRSKGFSVTQASVSRDLDELGVVKVGGRYARVEVGNGNASPFGLSAIETAGDNLIVVRCSSGLASAAAVNIDAQKFAEIVGTIAGDDTIFVAVKDAAGQKAVVKKLRSLFATM